MFTIFFHIQHCVHILSRNGYMFTNFFPIQYIRSHSFTPLLYVNNLLSHSCSHCFTPRLYVHNLLSYSVYTITFFHTPTTWSQSYFTFSIYVHILSQPYYMFTIFFHIHVHTVSHPDYMFTVFFHIEYICSHSFTPGNIFTFYFHIQHICSHYADYRDVSLTYGSHFCIGFPSATTITYHSTLKYFQSSHSVLCC
jgi:hypothetical protein